MPTKWYSALFCFCGSQILRMQGFELFCGYKFVACGMVSFEGRHPDFWMAHHSAGLQLESQTIEDYHAEKVARLKIDAEVACRVHFILPRNI